MGRDFRSSSYYRERSRSPPGYRRHAGERDAYERGGPRDRRDRRRDSDSPLSFKQFMNRHVPEDVQPREAEIMYKDYLVKCAGDSKRAWFKEHRNRPDIVDKYQPEKLEDLVRGRMDEAKRSAARFIDMGADADAGACDTDASAVAFAPPFCGRPERIAKDLALLSHVVLTLDKEKDILNNPMQLSAPDGDAGEGDAGDAPADADAAGAEKLDGLLRYAWRVHGVDYYANKELSVYDFEKRLSSQCTARPANDDGASAPLGTTREGSDAMETEAEGNGGEEGNGAAAKEGEWIDNLEKHWRERIENGDVKVEKMLGKEKTNQGVAAFVKNNIQMIDENKFMCKLCTKLFKGEEFVEKHIQNRHPEVIDQVKAEILQNVFMDNFLEDKTFTEHEDEFKDVLDLQNNGRQPREPQRSHEMMMGGRPEGGMSMYGPGPARDPRGSGTGKAYVDLDAPKSNQEGGRAVLDYGDL